MSGYTIVPGRGKVKNSDTVFGCGIGWSSGSSSPQPKPSTYDKTKAEVYATGNKWAIENFHATHD